VNGAFNYTGDANTESWIAVLGAMEDLGVKTLCPGHGEMGGAEILANQKRWFLELRGTVKAGIDKGLSLEAIKDGFDVPFYKEWTGKESKAQSENIEHVFKELSNPKELSSPGKPLGLKSRLHRHPHPHPSQPAVGTVGNKR
jgi:hypothetical protein